MAEKDIDRGRGPGRNIVYVDGACTSNKKVGHVAGWAMFWGDYHPFNDKGPVEGAQTHYRAVLYAACEAAEKAYNKQLTNLTIRTDSRRLYDTMNKDIQHWRSNGWKMDNGSPVSNKDLMEELDWYRQRVNIVFEPVDAKVDEILTADTFAWKAAHEHLESRCAPARNRINDNKDRQQKYMAEALCGNGLGYNRRHLRDGYESDDSTKANGKFH